MSTKSILIFKSSPRKNSNSTILADEFARGAGETGASVQSFSLQSMNIKPCTACDHCLREGVCNIDDDMQTLYPLLKDADIIVVASPVYWFTLSAQAKLCIDRWYGLLMPGGSCWLQGKQFVLILTYGDTNLETSGGSNAVHTFQDMTRYLQADLAGVIHGSAGNAGDIKKQPALLEQAYQLGKKLGKETPSSR